MFKFLFIFINILFFGSRIYSQESDNDLVTKKVLQTHKISQKISIDGQLNEEVWSTTESATNFVMFEPDNGKPISEDLKTEIRILYDNEGIYIGAKLKDSEPQKILKEITERDNFGTSDVFGIFINGFNDGQQDFRFFVTAAGGQLDCVATDQSGEDFSWNAIWTSKAIITEDGWQVEMKIPYAALRFSNLKEQTWGLNFVREVRRYRQVYTWQPINAKIGAVIQQAGILKGIKNIKPPTRLFLIPYASGYYEHSNGLDEFTAKGGMDIKYGINDAFTLDAILVPDFGQTRFDNVILNLGPFEQQFNENRPFFTEGLELFNKGNLLYSRRIGALPSVDLNLNENESLTNLPSAVNLLNATKISGRDKSGLGVGFLNALTEETTATAINDIDNSKRKTIVSPLTNYNVTVLDQRFNKNSSITLINTNVLREGSFEDANVLGLLFDLNTKKNTFNTSGEIKMSSKYGNNVSNGYNANIFVAETAGNFRFSSGVNYVSKEYDINDLGINFLTNYTSWSTNANYRILNPTKLFNTFRVNFNSYFEYNNQTGRIQSNNINLNIRSTSRNNHFTGMGLFINPFDSYNYYEPRQEGKFAIYPKQYGGWVYFSSNYNNKFAIDLNPNVTFTSEKNRYNLGLSISPRYRFNDKFSMVYSLDIDKLFNDVGYIDNDATNIYFASRYRDNLTNSLSAKYSINSDMNFNLSIRHYWSVVENNKIFTLEDNGTLTEDNLYEENKNSNFNTWNLDLTYSWWFAPGSQLSFLYRNNAFNFNRELDRNFSANLSNLLSNNLNQIVSISIRYFIDYNQLKGLVQKS